jgi:hypothetical protein
MTSVAVTADAEAAVVVSLPEFLPGVGSVNPPGPPPSRYWRGFRWNGVMLQVTCR